MEGGGGGTPAVTNLAYNYIQTSDIYLNKDRSSICEGLLYMFCEAGMYVHTYLVRNGDAKKNVHGSFTLRSTKAEMVQLYMKAYAKNTFLSLLPGDVVFNLQT